ncbi:MAG: type II toxin-antitoxin system HicB family antitoxin [Acidobacteria bacterium]|nr:type II toxin-antitoxin system HicB family antitoxin [Acidobacteriota bacterium]
MVRKVTFYLKGTIRPEGNWYVAECIGLPVVTQGKTDGEAMANLLEAAQLFVEDCLARGTLERVLLKYHWKPRLNPPREVPRGEFAFPVPLPLIVKRHLDECRM